MPKVDPDKNPIKQILEDSAAPVFAESDRDVFQAIAAFHDVPYLGKKEAWTGVKKKRPANGPNNMKWQEGMTPGIAPQKERMTGGESPFSFVNASPWDGGFDVLLGSGKKFRISLEGPPSLKHITAIDGIDPSNADSLSSEQIAAAKLLADKSTGQSSNFPPVSLDKFSGPISVFLFKNPDISEAIGHSLGVGETSSRGINPHEEELAGKTIPVSEMDPKGLEYLRRAVPSENVNEGEDPREAIVSPSAEELEAHGFGIGGIELDDLENEDIQIPHRVGASDGSLEPEERILPWKKEHDPSSSAGISMEDYIKHEFETERINRSTSEEPVEPESEFDVFEDDVRPVSLEPQDELKDFASETYEQWMERVQRAGQQLQKGEQPDPQDRQALQMYINFATQYKGIQVPGGGDVSGRPAVPSAFGVQASYHQSAEPNAPRALDGVVPGGSGYDPVSQQNNPYKLYTSPDLYGTHKDPNNHEFLSGPDAWIPNFGPGMPKSPPQADVSQANGYQVSQPIGYDQANLPMATGPLQQNVPQNLLNEWSNNPKASAGEKKDTPSPKAAEAVFKALDEGNHDQAHELMGHTDCPMECTTQNEGVCKHGYMSAGRTRVIFLDKDLRRASIRVADFWDSIGDVTENALSQVIPGGQAVEALGDVVGINHPWNQAIQQGANNIGEVSNLLTDTPQERGEWSPETKNFQQQQQQQQRNQLNQFLTPNQ